MIESFGYAAKKAKGELTPFSFKRRDLRDNDVLIKIHYCGICHSDIHQVDNDWQGSIYPMVPGHEIVGSVLRVGKGVSKFKEGDKVGVGCYVDSCQECSCCKDHLEHLCEKGVVATYSSKDYDSLPTYGGYSNNIVVRSEFVLKIPDNLDFAACAPLLCAGITMYSPLMRWKVTKGDELGVVGLGGLGHMAVKLGAAMGAKVTVFTTSKSKFKDAVGLGATDVVFSKDLDEMKKQERRFDLILNSVAAVHDFQPYLKALNHDGKMIMVGIPGKPFPNFSINELVFYRRTIAGSLVGGIKETQEMLDFCSKHHITSDIEMISMDQVNEAYKKTIQGDVKYRFVIDLATLKQE